MNKIHSLHREITVDQIKAQRVYSKSFISFDSAVRAAITQNGYNINNYQGFNVTEEGIELIWK